MSSLHIQKRSIVLLQICLILWPFLSVPDQAAADDSFTTTISFYAGFDLTSGMTELDPTVLTLIIGDGQEIEAIAARGSIRCSNSVLKLICISDSAPMRTDRLQSSPNRSKA